MTAPAIKLWSSTRAARSSDWDVFQSLPAGPKIDPVSDFGIARNRANLRVKKIAPDERQRPGRPGISVNADKNFLVGADAPARSEGIGFTRVWLVKIRGTLPWLLLNEGPPA